MATEQRERSRIVYKENWRTFKARLRETERFSPDDQYRISFAYDLAKIAHRNQRRGSGERYFEHPRQVALILLDECKINDPDLIISALLHDAVEDTILFGHYEDVRNSEFRDVAQRRLNQVVGPRAAEMILAVTKPKVDGREIRSKHEAHVHYMEQLFYASPEALLIKMADRLHNLRTLGVRTPADRNRIIDETKQDYWPLFRFILLSYPQEGIYLMEQMELAIKETMNGD